MSRTSAISSSAIRTRSRIACDAPRALAATLVSHEDVQGVRVEPDGEHVIVETNRPRTFFARCAAIALSGRSGIRGYTTSDDDLKSLFEYLVEDAS